MRRYRRLPEPNKRNDPTHLGRTSAWQAAITDRAAAGHDDPLLKAAAGTQPRLPTTTPLISSLSALRTTRLWPFNAPAGPATGRAGSDIFQTQNSWTIKRGEPWLRLYQSEAVVNLMCGKH
jgi:hypothetical protein